ncbi:MAG: HlyD family secretion protein [Phycisphaerales bacterium]
MYVRTIVIPLVALAGIALAVQTVRSENRQQPAAPPVAAPAKSPYSASVAGAGLVEASTQNIAIGAPVAGVVVEVPVVAGAQVKAGDALFRVDDRAAKAELEVRRAALRGAEAELEQLVAQPRSEDLPPARARVAETRAILEDLRAQLANWEAVPDKRAVAQDTLSSKRFAVKTAESRLAESEAQLALLEAGAWGPLKKVAEARVASARASMEAAQTEVDRLTVRAPVSGQVLQVNIRVGEYAPANAGSGLVLMGETRTLHVRVDVDENDAWRLKPGASARASLRGNSALKVELKFVRIEPYVIPKRSLTGDSSERVDTRVLQVIYAFAGDALPVYPGQQMDVFIDAPAATPGAAGSGTP